MLSAALSDWAAVASYFGLMTFSRVKFIEARHLTDFLGPSNNDLNEELLCNTTLSFALRSLFICCTHDIWPLLVKSKNPTSVDSFRDLWGSSLPAIQFGRVFLVLLYSYLTRVLIHYLIKSVTIMSVGVWQTRKFKYRTRASDDWDL